MTNERKAIPHPIGEFMMHQVTFCYLYCYSMFLLCSQEKSAQTFGQNAAEKLGKYIEKAANPFPLLPLWVFVWKSDWVIIVCVF